MLLKDGPRAAVAWGSGRSPVSVLHNVGPRQRVDLVSVVTQF